MTDKTIIRKLRAELKKTDERFSKHIKAWDCTSDSCTLRCRFQERLASLRWAIKAAGGRVCEDDSLDTTNE
jgi:hypothetical protein